MEFSCVAWSLGFVVSESQVTDGKWEIFPVCWGYFRKSVAIFGIRADFWGWRFAAAAARHPGTVNRTCPSLTSQRFSPAGISTVGHAFIFFLFEGLIGSVGVENRGSSRSSRCRSRNGPPKELIILAELSDSAPRRFRITLLVNHSPGDELSSPAEGSRPLAADQESPDEAHHTPWLIEIFEAGATPSDDSFERHSLLPWKHDR